MLLPALDTQIEFIEVVRITAAMRDPFSDDLAGEDIALWEAGETRQALQLISALPGDELHRCFMPGWGLGAHGGTSPLFQIAFCFHCHGARLWGPEVPRELQGIHGFDPHSPPAQSLLARFRSADALYAQDRKAASAADL